MCIYLFIISVSIVCIQYIQVQDLMSENLKDRILKLCVFQRGVYVSSFFYDCCLRLCSIFALVGPWTYDLEVPHFKYF